jgi:hypothetical protein
MFITSFLFLLSNSLTSMTEQTTQKTEDELIKKLDAYSTDRWEVGIFFWSVKQISFCFYLKIKTKAVLKYIVNPKEYKNLTSISTKDILKFAGLMKM